MKEKNFFILSQKLALDTGMSSRVKYEIILLALFPVDFSFNAVIHAETTANILIHLIDFCEGF